MKKTLKIAGFICVVVMTMHACTPDRNFTVGQPQNRLAQLAGTWKLENVTQVDLLAKSNNFVDPSRPDVNIIQEDITDMAPFTDMTVMFAEDAGNVPSTFTINYGQSPKIFKISTGTWKVDDLKTPGNIKFINGTDTVSTGLGNVTNLSSNIVTLQRIKYQGTKPVIQYNYTFKKTS
jgi:hypothetical protein